MNGPHVSESHTRRTYARMTEDEVKAVLAQHIAAKRSAVNGGGMLQGGYSVTLTRTQMDGVGRSDFEITIVEALCSPAEAALPRVAEESPAGGGFAGAPME